MSGPSAGDLAIGAAGAAIVLATLADVFVTVFNYDGFSFLANGLHGVLSPRRGSRKAFLGSY